MLTKEDYMKLSKERLAELLVERDLPVIHLPFSQTLPCYAPDGICINPQRDCINCPKTYGTSGVTTTTNTTGQTINAHTENPLDYIERLNRD